MKVSCRYSGINNHLTIIIFCMNTFKRKVLVISVIPTLQRFNRDTFKH